MKSTVLPVARRSETGCHDRHQPHFNGRARRPRDMRPVSVCCLWPIVMTRLGATGHWQCGCPAGFR